MRPPAVILRRSAPTNEQRRYFSGHPVHGTSADIACDFPFDLLAKLQLMWQREILRQTD